MASYIINRHNQKEDISFDKIKKRIDDLLDGLTNVSTTNITIQTISRLMTETTTIQLDIESARVCASLESTHYNYGILGGRILASNMHKNLKIRNLNTFSDKLKYLASHLNDFFNTDFINYVSENYLVLDDFINYKRDYTISYFGFKTLEKSYLLKVADDIIETPQDLYLRVAIAIHFRNNRLDLIKSTYDLMSNGYMTHATPTLFNAGTKYEQLSSCYLLGTEDNLTGIFKTISDAAQISKWAGGIGVHVSNVRANGSLIHSTNGKTDGIVPMLKVYNEVARYVSQGGKRKGAIAIYLEPWHADIEGFLDIKKNTGAETERARDLFTALWICDEFMKRVENDDVWYLMCPYESPGLTEVYGDQFLELYNSYIQDKKFRKEIKARELFYKIMESLIETGVPYILYKDNINKKCNQSNIGIVKSSNLCAEITEVSSSKEYSVCNLASIAVNKFLKSNYVNINELKNDELVDAIKTIYDFDLLFEVAKQVTNNLNNIIDYNFYPIPETKLSNINNRPIGIGIQGLGDLYYMLNIPYNSYASKLLDSLIMETIYYGAITESNNIATVNGSYPRFNGSPFSEGIFQFDMYNIQYPQMYDWQSLKDKVKKYGTANSLLTALMPTATTSQILGNNECFEPYSSNIYKRTTLAGEFQVINKHLVNKLIELNLWNENMKNAIIKDDGSIQNIPNISPDIKNVFKTIWEIKQKEVIDHALARAPYVDQSQSMNLFFSKPNFTNLYSALMYGWKNGLKTGCYYLRSKPATEAIKYGLQESEVLLCSLANKDECKMCSA
jgi:ribonucleoside-diphosphate reductase alpha subunit